MPQTYSKDNFDRFCDDLCEMLLSYLTVEDRFRYECLSTQWQRSVYATQTLLTIDEKFMLNSKYFDANNAFKGGFRSLLKRLSSQLKSSTKPMERFLMRLECVVKKLPNISKIVAKCNDILDDESIELLVKYCMHLNAIDFETNVDISDESIDEFFGTFGKDLREVSFTATDTTLANVLPVLHNCPDLWALNLRAIGHEFDLKYSHVFNDCLQMKFKSLAEYTLHYSGDSVDGFPVFVKNHGKCLRTLRVTIDGQSCDETSIESLMTGVSHLSALIDLQIVLKDCVKNSSIVALLDQLRLIGDMCSKLKRLTLNGVFNSSETFTRVVQTIYWSFKRLKRLQISGNSCEKFVLMSETLIQCKRLTHLTLDTECLLESPSLREKFYINFGHNFRKLQFLSLSKLNITNGALNSLSKLPKIQTIRLYGRENFTQTTVNKLITNCPKIKWISINDRNYMDINTEFPAADESFGLANDRALTEQYCWCCYLSGVRDLLEIPGPSPCIANSNGLGCCRGLCNSYNCPPTSLQPEQYNDPVSYVRGFGPVVPGTQGAAPYDSLGV